MSGAAVQRDNGKRLTVKLIYYLLRIARRLCPYPVICSPPNLNATHLSPLPLSSTPFHLFGPNHPSIFLFIVSLLLFPVEADTLWFFLIFYCVPFLLCVLPISIFPSAFPTLLFTRLVSWFSILQSFELFKIKFILQKISNQHFFLFSKR